MSESLPWTHEYDVVVVGGGGAGMATAISAAETEPSLDVLLVQKISALGGSTTMAVGSFTAAETELQAAAGIDDSTDAHFEDVDKFVEAHATGAGKYFYLDYDGDLKAKDDLELRRLLVENAADTLQWLRDMGCEYSGPHPEPPHRVPRMHNIAPGTEVYPDILGDELEELGVDVRFDTEVYELAHEGGTVQGVLAKEDGRRQPLIIRARQGVVLATGDYINSRELREEYTTVVDAEAINEHNTGDGHSMAEAIGAQLTNMDIQFLALRLGDPLYTGPEFPSMVDEGAILVNESGSRFVNETVDYDQIFTSTQSQTRQHTYVVFDDRIAQQFTEWPHPISSFSGIAWGYLEDYMDYEVLQVGEDPATVADKSGLTPATLDDTVEAYNDAARAARVDQYGRTEHLEPLTDPPYYVLGPLRPYSLLTDGRLEVDTSMRVLDTNDQPIDGLYAVGSAGGGLHLFGHGHHQAWIFTSGRIAGREVARET